MVFTSEHRRYIIESYFRNSAFNNQDFFLTGIRVSNSPRCGPVNSGSDNQDSYRHANKTSNKARLVTNFNIRGKLRQFSGKSLSSRRTRRLIAANHSPNLLEKAGRMFEIPANFNWRGLKDGVGKTDTIIIIDMIDIIIDPQTDRRRKNHQKIIIQGSNHSQSSSSVAKRKSSYSK
jgi:hypothetical protein